VRSQLVEYGAPAPHGLIVLDLPEAAAVLEDDLSRRRLSGIIAR